MPKSRARDGLHAIILSSCAIAVARQLLPLTQPIPAWVTMKPIDANIAIHEFRRPSERSERATRSERAASESA